MTTTHPQAGLTEAAAARIATAAYIFGYPLVTLEMTRREATNTTAPAGLRAPMNQFAHGRQFPPITYRDIPGANVDTLYSAAWLDLTAEPYVLSIPASDGLYFMVPMLNGWSEVFRSPGTRTSGTEAQTYLITGPGWSGEIPAGIGHFESATNLAWIVGRTYCDGTPEDYERVHSFQERLSLIPLSAYGSAYSPPAGEVDPTIDMQVSTKDQVVQMHAASYFALLAELMKDNPPTGADDAIVAEMAKIGLVPGHDYDLGALDPTVAKGVTEAPKAALEAMAAHPSGRVPRRPGSASRNANASKTLPPALARHPGAGHLQDKPPG